MTPATGGDTYCTGGDDCRAARHVCGCVGRLRERWVEHHPIVEDGGMNEAQDPRVELRDEMSHLAALLRDQLLIPLGRFGWRMVALVSWGKVRAVAKDLGTRR